MMLILKSDVDHFFQFFEEFLLNNYIFDSHGRRKNYLPYHLLKPTVES